MRDRAGVERGQCFACARAGVECSEFTFVCCGDDPDDSDSFPDPSDLQPEEYRKNPLLRCIRARLEQRLPALSSPTVCAGCGCLDEAHEALSITEDEARILAVARRVFAPFDLSVCIRQSVQDTSNLGLWRESFTYGEVNLLSFLCLLDRVRAHRAAAAGEPPGGTAAGGAFFDLGCGAGKCAVLAAMHSSGFSRCVGVELLPGLHAISQAVQGRFAAEAPAMAAGCGVPPSEVIFLEADFFDVDLADACVVLINAGSWCEPGLSKLREHLVGALPDRCLLATIRHTLCRADCPELRPVEEFRLPMSWGLAPVFLAERQPREADTQARLEVQLVCSPLPVPFNLMSMD